MYHAVNVVHHGLAHAVRPQAPRRRSLARTRCMKKSHLHCAFAIQDGPRASQRVFREELKRLVGTPYKAASSLSSMTLRPRIIWMWRSMGSSGNIGFCGFRHRKPMEVSVGADNSLRRCSRKTLVFPQILIQRFAADAEIASDLRLFLAVADP